MEQEMRVGRIGLAGETNISREKAAGTSAFKELFSDLVAERLGKIPETLETMEAVDKELKELEYTFDILYINSDVYLQESDNRHQSIRAKSPVSRSAFDSEHITSGLRLTVAQCSDADRDRP